MKELVINALLSIINREIQEFRLIQSNNIRYIISEIYIVRT
jgi:hypothetical protein